MFTKYNKIVFNIIFALSLFFANHSISQQKKAKATPSDYTQYVSVSFWNKKTFMILQA